MYHVYTDLGGRPGDTFAGNLVINVLLIIY